ncbi:MAG: DUF1295 domain-containing protein [Rectinema sp.]
MNALLIALGISFLVNALFFVFASIKKTDVVTDLSYGLSFFLTSLGLALVTHVHGFFWLFPFVAVMLWAARLSFYLFRRILTIKVDHRFDGRREDPVKFAQFWILQAVSTVIIMLPVIIGASREPVGFSFLQLLGGLVWLIGLLIEAVADAQKFKFKKNNPDGFVSTGMWSWSRHPNYFGEMLVWWGLWLYVLPSLQGWENIAVLGPLYITILLRFVSGVPLLEKTASGKYGSLPEYKDYVSSTHLLFPWPPKSKSANARSSTASIPTIGSLSDEEFAGRWYELGRIPLPVARDWIMTSDVYEKQPDGTWRVRYEGKPDQDRTRTKVLRQKLKRPDAAAPGEMLVSFLPGIWMKYRAIHMSSDRQSMLVTSSKMKYLWIMSRNADLPEEEYQTLLSTAASLGFDTRAVEKVPQH